MAALICFCAVAVPLEIGYDASLHRALGPNGWSAWISFNYFVDIVFVLDIVLSFRTGFLVDGHHLVSDWRLIAISYLRGTFIIDLVGSFPFNLAVDLANQLSGGGDNGGGGQGEATARLNKQLRLLRIAKLNRLLRLSKLSSSLKAVEVMLSFNPSAFRVLKLVLVMVCCCHYMGCAWWLVAGLELESALTPQNSWQPDAFLLNSDLGTQFASGFFWGAGIVTAMVPYDVMPHTQIEYYVTATCMFIGLVLNAFVIMLIFMAIYAILAVDYFRSFGGSYGPLPGGTGKLCMHGELEHASNGHGCSSFQTTVAIEFPEFVNGSYANQSHSALSQRGYVIGDEYYGTFSRALFTLFQVLTGDAWAEVVVRPLLFGYNSAGALSATFVGLFFASYLLLMQIVLINVVVAVLLDKFVEEEPAPADAEGEEGEGGEGVPSVAQTEGLGSDGRPPCASFAPATAVDATESKANTSKANTARIAGAGVLPPPGAVSSGSLGAGGGSGGGVEGQLHALRADMKSMAAKLETVSSMRQQIERLAQSLDATAAAGGGAKGAPEARAGGARSEKGSDSNRSDSLLKA